MSALRFASVILGKSSTFYLDAFTEVARSEGRKKKSPTLNNSVLKVTMCNINVSILAAIVQRVLKQVRAMSDSFVSRSLLEQINFGVEGTPVYIYIYTYENHKLYRRQIYTCIYKCLIPLSRCKVS